MCLGFLAYLCCNSRSSFSSRALFGFDAVYAGSFFTFGSSKSSYGAAGCVSVELCISGFIFTPSPSSSTGSTP
ncbi:hypothetical protein BDZ85DRAFT_266199 [Elsinoe ampelina]|uniref:Uncharacterized protein n=1 Tax=Elsinoe ampelina TaxID=302913 RepID=A0A6A6G5K3_9PEZI|nr:hypothetical protein BDZ85DRAFT_266199 [Elsinoe ampelina]